MRLFDTDENGNRVEIEYTPFDETVTSLDAWYDRHSRNWVIQKLNNDGYQIGDAIYVYSKQEKDAWVKQLKAEYNI